MKKLTVRLDDETVRQLKFLALERDESLQTMLEALIRDFLAREQKRGRRRR